jgi:4-amino-4-deoxy-L-arabinose transferase-like glycosyltransferase
MTRTDRFALILCFASLFINALVANRVFENIPHLEDETTLVWQAELITRGQVMVPTPPSPQSFLVPFVVDYHGYRFGKYPLGFPVLLSFGMRLGARDWVNPFIAACTLWLIYRLGKKLLDEKTALLAVFLTAFSPFFLINSSNLLTHAWSLFLSVCLALAWLDTFFYKPQVPGGLTLLVAGLSLGVLALTRPWTAVGVALPFFAHGLFLFWRGTPADRRLVLIIGLLAGAVASIHFLWQAVLTGSPWLNPYTLWWPGDQVGFGPGIGFRPGGHTLIAGIWDALFSLVVASHDLFGWPWLSWIFLPFGLLAIRANPPAKWVSLVFPSLVFVYIAYWVGAWIYGPRYYYEGLYSLTLLSAAGIAWIYRRLPLPELAIHRAENSRRPGFHFVNLAGITKKSLASILFTCLLGLLIAGNLALYAPLRLSSLYGLYHANRALLTPFSDPKAQIKTPALIIVHDTTNFHPYETLTQLSDPFLDTPFVFALSKDPAVDQALAADFPDRKVYYYDPLQPGQFLVNPPP